MIDEILDIVVFGGFAILTAQWIWSKIVYPKRVTWFGSFKQWIIFVDSKMPKPLLQAFGEQTAKK